MVALAIFAVGQLLLIGSLWTAIYLFNRWQTRLREDVAASVRAIVEAPNPETPSLLAVYSDQVATILAARIMQQLKAGVAGIASGQAREAEAGALQAVAGQSPWLALLSGLLPAKYRKALLSAPQFTGQLKLGQAVGQGDNHNTQQSDVAARLKFQ